MLKTRIYIIVQIMSIILLICGYFLSDQPDSLSVMHFDPNPACPSVISKAIKSNVNGLVCQTTVSSQNNSNRKTNVPKYVSYEIVLISKSGYSFHAVNPPVFSSSLPDTYSYLYYEDINPPPPKGSMA
jgi:hypothetical protein